VADRRATTPPSNGGSGVVTQLQTRKSWSRNHHAATLGSAVAAEPTGGNYNNVSYRSLRSRSRSQERGAETTLAPPNPIAKQHASLRDATQRAVRDQPDQSSTNEPDENQPVCRKPSRIKAARVAAARAKDNAATICFKAKLVEKATTTVHTPKTKPILKYPLKTTTTTTKNPVRPKCRTITSQATKCKVAGEILFQIIPQARRRCSTKQGQAQDYGKDERHHDSDDDDYICLRAASDRSTSSVAVAGAAIMRIMKRVITENR
jgi:hypothetical protein